MSEEGRTGHKATMELEWHLMSDVEPESGITLLALLRGKSLPIVVLKDSLNRLWVDGPARVYKYDVAWWAQLDMSKVPLP